MVMPSLYFNYITVLWCFHGTPGSILNYNLFIFPVFVLILVSVKGFCVFSVCVFVCFIFFFISISVYGYEIPKLNNFFLM